MKVIIFGIGDLSKQLLYYLEQDSNITVSYFCVHRKYYTEENFLGKRVLVFEDDLSNLNRDEFSFIIGVGYKSLRARKEIFIDIKREGFNLINYVHPSVKNYGSIEGEGNIIFPNVMLEPFSCVKNNNIIWSNTLICHDAIIGEHNFIAANCVIGGFSKVINNNFIGFNSTVIQNITIDEETLIGAKSLILSSTHNNSVYYGAPAKRIKKLSEKGICIY